LEDQLHCQRILIETGTLFADRRLPDRINEYLEA